MSVADGDGYPGSHSRTQGARIAASLAATMPQRTRSFSHVPFEPVGHLSLPPIAMPFALSLSPHLEAAREHVVTWAGTMGILSEGVWDERRLRAADLALCAAGIHPDATADQLDITTGWLAWRTYGDDYYPAVFGRRGDIAGAKTCNRRLTTFMPLDLAAMPAPVTALERSLADLWTRTVAGMGSAARAAVRRSITDMTGSWIWELVNQEQNRIPDPVDYIEMRRAEPDVRAGYQSGWTQVIIPVESPESAVADLLRLGADVEIVAPERGW